MSASQDTPTQVEQMMVPPSAHGVRSSPSAMFTTATRRWSGAGRCCTARAAVPSGRVLGRPGRAADGPPPGTGDVAISVAQLVPTADCSWSPRPSSPPRRWRSGPGDRRADPSAHRRRDREHVGRWPARTAASWSRVRLRRRPGRRGRAHPDHRGARAASGPGAHRRPAAPGRRPGRPLVLADPDAPAAAGQLAGGRGRAGRARSTRRWPGSAVGLSPARESGGLGVEGRGFLARQRGGGVWPARYSPSDSAIPAAVPSSPSSPSSRCLRTKLPGCRSRTSNRRTPVPAPRAGPWSPHPPACAAHAGYGRAGEPSSAAGPARRPRARSRPGPGSCRWTDRETRQLSRRGAAAAARTVLPSL